MEKEALAMAHQKKALLSIREAAEQLGVSPARLYQLIAAGRCPATRWGPRKLVIPKSALDAFVVGKANEATAHLQDAAVA